MSVLKKRLPRILVTIGIALLITLYIIDFSSTLDFTIQTNYDIEHDDLDAFLFKTESDVFIQATERDNHRFSLYVYGLNVTADEINIQIPKNGTALVVAENITYFAETVDIPSNGLYLIYMAPVDTLPIRVHATITRVGTSLTIFLIGLITISVGAFIIIVDEFLPMFLSERK